MDSRFTDERRNCESCIVQLSEKFLTTWLSVADYNTKRDSTEKFAKKNDGRREEREREREREREKEERR